MSGTRRTAGMAAALVRGGRTRGKWDERNGNGGGIKMHGGVGREEEIERGGAAGNV